MRATRFMQIATWLRLYVRDMHCLTVIKYGMTFFVAASLFSLGICGAQITVANTLTGQTGTFAIQNLCPTCGGQDLNLSPGAFQQIAGVGQTTLNGTCPSSGH